MHYGELITTMPVTQRIRCFHLPRFEVEGGPEPLRYGEVEVEVPPLSPAQLRRAIAQAREVSATRLRRRTVSELMESIDRIVSNWLRLDYPLRERAEAVLPAVTGFSPEMIHHGLPLLLEPLRGAAVRSLLDAELGDHRVLDAISNGRCALGPGLITHVLSGNIPGLAAAPMLLSLALKAPVLVKSAAGDPVFPALLASSIAEVDPDLGDCVLVTYWRGGAAEIEEVALSSAEVVVASGSDAAMAALAPRVPGRFIGHGHKISFATIGRECLADLDNIGRLARALAYDVSLWDQQGCLSPQLCYIEDGGRFGLAAFAEQLGAGLAAYATELPPRRLDLSERAQVLRFRQQAEWSAGVPGMPRLLASSNSTDWSISIETSADFLPTCLNRCVRLKVIGDLSELPAVIEPHRRHLEAVGLAVEAGRLGTLSAMLAHSGLHRVCPLGKMQRPPLSWRQGGRPRVADWVRWTGVEEGLGA